MTLIKTEPSVPGLDDATTTAAKRIARFIDRTDWDKIAKRERKNIVIPGVDTAALSRKYGMEAAAAPTLIEGTFRVPFGVSLTIYLRLRTEALHTFIETMGKRGYEFYPSYGIKVEKGMYPAVDMLSRKLHWDQREMRILAYFRFRKPEPVRIELPPHLLADRVATN